jgi:hypothetical protein
VNITSDLTPTPDGSEQAAIVVRQIYNFWCFVFVILPDGRQVLLGFLVSTFVETSADTLGGIPR